MHVFKINRVNESSDVFTSNSTGIDRESKLATIACPRFEHSNQEFLNVQKLTFVERTPFPQDELALSSRSTERRAENNSFHSSVDS